MSEGPNLIYEEIWTKLIGNLGRQKNLGKCIKTERKKDIKKGWRKKKT